jgi:DNA-3-methyladenine glycosylase I
VNPERCEWPGNDELMTTYHDVEWGVPLHDDQKLFEFMILDAMQAGLSWRTVLYKREAFERAMHGFDVARISKYGGRDVERLMANADIIRNRQKIEGSIVNARSVLEVQDEFGSLDSYLWQFVGGTPITNAWKRSDQVPATSKEAEAMSKALKSRGFKFVGPTICYAFMQAAGMVNDHVTNCFRYGELTAS